MDQAARRVASRRVGGQRQRHLIHNANFARTVGLRFNALSARRRPLSTRVHVARPQLFWPQTAERARPNDPTEREPGGSLMYETETRMRIDKDNILT